MPFNDPIKQRAASRRHYEKHRDQVIAKAKEYSKIARDRIRTYITAHLKANPCVDCGEADPIILEFDHVAGKDFNISDAVRKGVSMKKLKDEIAKCEVRCSNCHRRKTYERSGLTHKD
jgi:5-methylcytosine-specific restriction endonuclease McrA